MEGIQKHKGDGDPRRLGRIEIGRAQRQFVQLPTPGGDGDLLTPLAHSREIVHAVPHARFEVVPDAGHATTAVAN